MTPDASDIINGLTLAQAFAWLARLQDSKRSPATEMAFKEWLAVSPTHEPAFTQVNRLTQRMGET